MHIIGTAGHVDHGKSALIAALTGTNPDRWIEEQVRGMTLDLGFAHLRFDDGVEGGIVDVPGHERFLHNMLAGAAGMEILLLVVDAVEGVMPQTLEHLAILQFLNVRRVIVVASKIDLVERERVKAACDRIAEQLRGTIAEDAPVIAVSVVTGENLHALRAALRDELAAMPPRDLFAPAYLPIDRVFALPGLGTIVTGTLMQGRIATGETLRVEPGGQAAHVRSLGVFGSTRERVEAGSRVALNVPGIARDDVVRGHAVVGTELSARQDLTVHFVPLHSALPLLRKRTPVRAYFGSAEVLGTLVAADVATSATEMRAELHLREPVVAFPGLRFVLRRPSPMTLLGGGYVEMVGAGSTADGAAPEEQTVSTLLRERGLEPLELHAIAFAANLREGVAADALARLVERGDAIALARPAAYVDASAARALLARALERLDAAHRDEPWAMGLTSIALARALGVPETLLVRVLEHYAGEGRVVNRNGYYAAVDHEPSFTPEQRAFFDHLVPIDSARAFAPIPFAGAAAAVKLSRLPGTPKAFDTMLARGALVKIGDDLYRGTQIAEIRTRVEAHLREHGRMTAAQFRDLLGTTRKYAVPLLEWLDAHAVTIRNGDYRTLRKRASA
jgi:selenocysteine-specific elongation factor